MATEINMPKCGISMMEGEVVTWFKEVGDEVKEGEIVLEFKENKAVHQVAARASGILKEILVQEGETARIGAVLGIIE